MEPRPFQDLVDWQCYGCGRLNQHGLQIKSRWENDEVVCLWQPQPFHLGHPGRVHAGVIATAVMCHAIWTATAVAYRREGREIREPLAFSYGTTSLKFDVVKPTPIGSTLTLRARVKHMAEERATVLCSVFVNNEETVRAESQLLKLHF